jgi:hypothetical protein
MVYMSLPSHLDVFAHGIPSLTTLFLMPPPPALHPVLFPNICDPSRLSSKSSLQRAAAPLLPPLLVQD